MEEEKRKEKEKANEICKPYGMLPNLFLLSTTQNFCFNAILLPFSCLDFLLDYNFLFASIDYIFCSITKIPKSKPTNFNSEKV